MRRLKPDSATRVDYQPAFPGQTRARGIRDSVPYEVQTVTSGPDAALGRRAVARRARCW